MNAKELAQLLNGRECRNEITSDEEKLAKENNLVVVFGESDDLMEFRGAIDDEVDCYDGGTAYLTKKGVIQNECDDKYCPYFEELQEQAEQIHAIWDNGDYLWSYKTDIPHETFEIFEDGEKECQGIVFSMNDLKERR